MATLFVGRDFVEDSVCSQSDKSEKIVLEESFNKSRQTVSEIVSIADKMQDLIHEAREANSKHAEWMAWMASAKKDDHNV